MDNRMLMNFIEHLYKEGFMKEYSKKHFIIKALNGKIEYFNKYPQLI